MSKPLIYTKPNCINCDKTKALFDTLGVEYDTVDITQDQEALNKILTLGFRAAPVVFTGDNQWGGYNEQAIREYAEGQNGGSDDSVWGD